MPRRRPAPPRSASSGSTTGLIAADLVTTDRITGGSSSPLTTGSVVVIDATPVPASFGGIRLDQVELRLDVTVLAEHLAPRRTRASLVVDQAITPRIHPGAELAADLTVDGDLVTLHIADNPTNPVHPDTPVPVDPAPVTTVAAFETTTEAAGRQS